MPNMACHSSGDDACCCCLEDDGLCRAVAVLVAAIRFDPEVVRDERRLTFRRDGAMVAV